MIEASNQLACALLEQGQLDEATHRAALTHVDAAVRRNATRALGRDAAGVALFFASAVMSDADPLTRLAALAKLGEFPTTPQIKSVVSRLVRNPANQQDEWLREAMDCYEKAETLRAPNNDDALLRWNACARSPSS